MGKESSGWQILWSSAMGTWLEQRRGRDKAISAKIRDNTENTSLNEEMLTKRKDKRHGEVWLSAGRWV